jgi:hypothetical protein
MRFSMAGFCPLHTLLIACNAELGRILQIPRGHTLSSIGESEFWCRKAANVYQVAGAVLSDQMDGAILSRLLVSANLEELCKAPLS